jgi:hypothetical protein
MAQGPFSNQIQNRNFLSPAGFKFILSKYPKVDFFSNQSSIPGINLGVAIQANYFKNIPIPGEKLSYDDLSLTFIVDENLENYLTIHNWMRGFGFPADIREYQNLLNQEPTNPGKQTASSGESNGTLIIYNSNFNPIVNVDFDGLFPISLSTINFDATVQDINYVTAEVTFKYTIYDIKPITK